MPQLRAALACLLVLAASAGGLARADAPTWDALSQAQRQILAPLQRDWPSIDAARRDKWLEVAARYPSMPVAERQRLQERMSSWARLTPNERARARVQFQETRLLPAEEKQARWEAYQALSEEERSSLAQRARPPAKGPAGADTGSRASTAAANGSTKSNLVVPLPSPRARVVAPSVVNARPGATTTTVTTPATPPVHHQPGLPKIAATPGFVDKATLLPKRGPQGAAVRRPEAASAPQTAPANEP